ncbi:GxxExxY protein [Candidatus Poribacteria bacterium]|nr:GxxExxY protein [Candidatus Poribacteria bacterium]
MLILKSTIFLESTIKAISELEKVHTAQPLNYLRAYRLEVGLLLNFGSKSMTFKRLILSPPNRR